MPGWNWQKIKQKLNDALRLNLHDLKIIGFLHRRYHLKIIDVLKNVPKTSAPVLVTLYD